MSGSRARGGRRRPRAQLVLKRHVRECAARRHREPPSSSSTTSAGLNLTTPPPPKIPSSAEDRADELPSRSTRVALRGGTLRYLGHAAAPRARATLAQGQRALCAADPYRLRPEERRSEGQLGGASGFARARSAPHTSPRRRRRAPWPALGRRSTPSSPARRFGRQGTDAAARGSCAFAPVVAPRPLAVRAPCRRPRADVAARAGRATLRPTAALAGKGPGTSASPSSTRRQRVPRGALASNLEGDAGRRLEDRAGRVSPGSSKAVGAGTTAAALLLAEAQLSSRARAEDRRPCARARLQVELSGRTVTLRGTGLAEGLSARVRQVVAEDLSPPLRAVRKAFLSAPRRRRSRAKACCRCPRGRCSRRRSPRAAPSCRPPRRAVARLLGLDPLDLSRPAT